MVKFILLRLFQSCRTKDHPSTLPRQQHHLPSPGELPCVKSSPFSKQTPERSSFKSHVFRYASKSTNQHVDDNEHLQRHVVPKLYDIDSPRSKISSDHGFQMPLLPVPPSPKKKNRRSRKRAYSCRFSTSYKVEDEKQPEILTRSFSDERLRPRHNVDVGGGEVLSPEWGSPARLSVFKKLMSCKVDGKVKESFAVVKTSDNPYEDFKKSMMEMIVENQLYEDSDLKQLLECLLSLNTRYHHGVIMEAFSEIWHTMFIDH
uniref:transcription repressor OFP7-like n=1 Tax=Erigeron canadensis TaxID=72917 RepID=UPI001CB9830C|nr:transcription repressor OFP7-like [Erigeron canadensis]